MYAAAAAVASTVFGLSKSIGKFVALKALLIALVIIVLPWVLKGFYGWCFERFQGFLSTILTAVMTQINGLSNGAYDFTLQLTGVGGYIAGQIGLLEYCSIIFTGWAAYLAIVTLRKFTPWI